MTLLSHYTDRAGLEGIARSKCIRATKFSQLNDKREIEYGYLELVRRVLLGIFDTLDQLIVRKPGSKLDLAEVEAKFLDHFRNSFDGAHGSEPLFVASFAKGRTIDHDLRGILTLWDRYTKLEGYCLQFDHGDVQKILELEMSRRHYALLTLDDVEYGVNEASAEYRDIAFQMKQRLLIEVLKGMPGLPVQPEYQMMWPFNLFATRMLRYIAKHKDPFFEDERETRIICVPAKSAHVRPLTGIAMVKQIETALDGRQFINVGEDWRPGLEPRRIIVGPRANRSIEDVTALFEKKPEIVNSEFPV